MLVLIGGILRFWGNTANPSELNIDEVSIGYNAYSILKTGKDEYGTFMPLSFKSVGDFKPPVLIYLTVPSIALFGLNEFAMRFPVALISTFGIVIIYLLAKKLTSNQTYALVATVLYSISPWIIYYSRYGVEAMIATVFLCTGFYFMLGFMERFSWKLGIFAGFFIVLSMYTYHSNRLFVPLFILFIIFYHFKLFINNWKKLLVPVMCTGVLLLPLLFNTIFGGDATRAQSTFITRDIELQRNILLLDHNELSHNQLTDLGLVIQHGVRKYLNYFTPEFLFLNGLGMTMINTYGLGVLYLFELPFLLFGIYLFLTKDIKNKWFIIMWILLGILPAALTQNEQHPLRTLLIAPAFILLSAIGGVELFKHIKKKYRTIVVGVFLTFVLWNVIYFYSIFTVQFPMQKDENFMYGSKEATLYALEHQDEYDEIIFDPVRGREGPQVVSIPHMYILFYSAYDPVLYQNEQKRMGEESFGFGKFTVRKVDWPKDRGESKKLYIASPWSLPEKDIKPELIKKKIYLHDGTLAFLVVSAEN